MRKLILLLSAILCFTTFIRSQEAYLFNISNAQILSKGKWESGLIQPFRIGISNKMEVYSSVLALPFIPNAGIKTNWKNEHNFLFTSMHSFSIPSPFLNLSSTNGTGGLIPPEFDFPFILSVSNSLLLSKPISSVHLFTLKFDYIFAIRTGEVDPASTIDMPVFYPRMAQYYEGSVFRIETNMTGKIIKKIFYEEYLRIFLVTRNQNNFFFENNGYINFLTGKCFNIKIGYNLSYGEYPFGNQWQLWPAFDFIFGNSFRKR